MTYECPAKQKQPHSTQSAHAKMYPELWDLCAHCAILLQRKKVIALCTVFNHNSLGTALDAAPQATRQGSLCSFSRACIPEGTADLKQMLALIVQSGSKQVKVESWPWMFGTCLLWLTDLSHVLPAAQKLEAKLRIHNKSCFGPKLGLLPLGLWQFRMKHLCEPFSLLTVLSVLSPLCLIISIKTRIIMLGRSLGKHSKVAHIFFSSLDNSGENVIIRGKCDHSIQDIQLL